MQKKCLLFMTILSASVVVCHPDNNRSKAEGRRPTIIEGAYPLYSSFDDLPDGLKERIPAHIREEAEQSYIKAQQDALLAVIEGYYKDALLKELQESGSIDALLIEKVKDNNHLRAQAKNAVCLCDRKDPNAGWFTASNPVETRVNCEDKIIDQNYNFINNEYIRAADRLLERFKGIDAILKSSDTANKDKLKILTTYLNALKKCDGLDLLCLEQEGVFEKHLTREFRHSLTNTIYVNAVDACAKKNIANELEFYQLWTNSAALRSTLYSIEDVNAEIEDLIDPEKVREREEKKQKELQELLNKRNEDKSGNQQE